MPSDTLDPCASRSSWASRYRASYRPGAQLACRILPTRFRWSRCLPSPPESITASRTAAPPLSGGVYEEKTAPSDDGDAPTDPRAPPFVSRCTGVSLVIVSVNTSHGALEPVVELRNAGPAAVPLMTTGDGSTADMRNPSIKFDISPKKLSISARCGNVKALSTQDFVTLARGARSKLGWLYAPSPSQACRYTIRATYTNDPSSQLFRGLAVPSDPTLVARTRATVPCQLTSNTFTFDWKMP